MNNEYQQAIVRAASIVKKLGAQGRVANQEFRAQMGGFYSTHEHGDLLQPMLEQYFTALASGDGQPTADEVAQIYNDAFAEVPKGLPGQMEYGDPRYIATSKAHALASARITKVNNFIYAYPGFKKLWFEEESLAMDEQPFIVNETENQTDITSIGEDGSPERHRFTKPQSRTAVGLFLKSSKKVRYKTLDLYRGNVADRIKSTVNIARDMAIDLDRTFFGLINQPASNGGAFGLFSYENANANENLRLWKAHSALDVTQLPYTNDYDLTQPPLGASNPCPIVGNLTGPDVNMIWAITDYCVRWGNLFGEAIEFTGNILMPAADIIYIAQKFLPVPNVYEQGIQKQLNENGYFEFHIQGVNVRLIPSLFLTRGTCYPELNRKPGISYSKPGFDREMVEVNIPENWEEVQQRKLYGAAIIAQRRMFALRLKVLGSLKLVLDHLDGDSSI